MRLGFNIAIVCIIAMLCVTAIVIVAVANGFDSALITGGIASLIGIPTFLITKITVERKYRNATIKRSPGKTEN